MNLTPERRQHDTDIAGRVSMHVLYPTDTKCPLFNIILHSAWKSLFRRRWPLRSHMVEGYQSRTHSPTKFQILLPAYLLSLREILSVSIE